MTQFSRKERLIASLLSATPRLKGLIKKAYVTFNYIIYRKVYRKRVLVKNGEINVINPLSQGDETFFGYYDKSPENHSGLVIFNESVEPTSRKPCASNPIKINIFDLKSGGTSNIGETNSYTWQQGCRAQWVSDTKLLYNFFDKKRYKCALYDFTSKAIVMTYDYPVQDSFEEEYYLSINYARIMNLRPDYGYRNLPLLSEQEMKRLDNDGIWKVDFSTGNSQLILSLADVQALAPKLGFNDSLHKVNHVMISPDGMGFIFIHRWYTGKVRHDRLIYSNFKQMKVLASENMVSHICWIDSDTVFGYLRHKAMDGFYFINISTGEFKHCPELTNLGNGDGHPSAWRDWIIVDTYPDKSRMQHLIIFNRKTAKVIKLLEVFQSVRYQGESRCDLHPRFSPDGSRVYFDTVFTGSRRLAYIDISTITHSSTCPFQ